MDKALKCPNCDSSNIHFIQKRRQYLCLDCSHEFEINKNIETRIFLSYGHDEFMLLASRLKKDLESEGYQVWFDEDRLVSGLEWESYIEEGLKWVSISPNKGRFILLMTPYSVRRPDGYCLNELTRALEMGLAVIPIMVSWCEPPLSICRIQWLDMQDCWPLDEREDRYKIKFMRLMDVLGQEVIDLHESQSHLLSILEPLSFNAEIMQHLSVFIGREWILKRIDAWVSDPNGSRIFLITGPPGVGKTAIASWLCYSMHDVVAFHFCRYGNVQKTDARKCILSIAYQLSTQLPEYRDRLNSTKLDQHIKESNAQTLFENLIVQPLSGNFPAPEKIMLIVIDALDEATMGSTNDLADFLATEFSKTPDWLRLIITTRPDPSVMHLLQGLTPFTFDTASDENMSDIRAYLAHELTPYNDGQKVPGTTLDTIVSKSDGIFLYAEWIRRELAQGRLSLKNPNEFPPGLGGVYAQFFKRQFSDIGLYKKKIRPMLEVMVAAQEPLTIETIISTLHINEYDKNEMIGSLGSLFQVVDRKFKPFHHTLIEWLMDNGRAGPYFVSVGEGHGVLAETGWKHYKNGDNLSRYTVTHLPTHMRMAGRFTELKELLGDIKFVHLAWNNDKFNFIKQWISVEAHTRLYMVELYEHILKEPDKQNDTDLSVIANLLQSTSHINEACKLLYYLIKNYRKKNDLHGLQDCLGKMADILLLKGHYNRAKTILKERENICRDIGDINSLTESYWKHAEILMLTGDMEGAKVLIDEQEMINRGTGNKEALSRFLDNQACLLRFKGDLDGALKLCRERVKLCRETGNMQSLQESLCEQAIILIRKGDLNSAEALLAELERICIDTGNKSGLRFSYACHGMILRMKGDLDGAMAFHKEDEKIVREIGYKIGIVESLWGQAIILRMKGDLDGAMALHKEEEKIAREIGHNRGVVNSLGSQAVILRMKGDLDGAIALHKEEEKIAREFNYQLGLQASLGGQAIVLFTKGDIEGALALLEDRKKICIEIGYKNELNDCLACQIMIMKAKGDDVALKILEEELDEQV